MRRPRRIDTATVDSLAAVVAAQRRAEDVLGSAAMLAPVTAQLAAIEDLVTEARGPVRAAVVDVASQWAQFTGRLYANTGDRAAAHARFGQALELATETGDPTIDRHGTVVQGAPRVDGR